ncbi:MAG: carboxypeptidase-like regulatory domain-containing protein [Rhodocyclaceae bacterium]|nr:carboxypeptidase-like regulatory domain-containing protein [Rhodocyclaceae bacterium]
MKIQFHSRARILAVRSAVLGAALAATLPAFAEPAEDALPLEHSQGLVTYRSGGIGEDEAKAMRQIARQYPLQLEFVAHEGDARGAYVADVNVSIRDGRGKEVLQTKADGPFLLARLPAGRYVVTAQYQDSQRERRVNVPAHGAEHVVFGW